MLGCKKSMARLMMGMEIESSDWLVSSKPKKEIEGMETGVVTGIGGRWRRAWR